MPNLMIGFLNDITHVSKTAADITSIARTSIEIQNTIMGGIKTAKGTSKRLKNGELMRSVKDWFNQKETFGESSSFAEEDDDFDAGFNTQLDEDQHSSALSADDMKDIGVGQTREMYRIANETYEAKIHTTAEIINAMDQRSSEILSSLHTTQSHLKHMLTTLDKIIVMQESKIAQQERHTSIFDDNGNISLKRVFDTMMYKFTSSRRSLLKHIMDRTGLTAFDEKGHEIITNMSNSLFSRLINNSVFKKIFGDQSKMHSSADYSAYIESDYTTDPAIFDGRVRKTIVDIIPGYLKAITHSLTGTVYHISEYGTLTTESPIDQFDKTIDITFHTNINQRYLNEIVRDTGNADDVDAAIMSKLQSILVSQYIFYVYKNGIKAFDADMLDAGGIKSIHEHVAILFANQTQQKYSYWIKMLSYIEARMATDKHYRRSFARAVNAGFNRLDTAAKNVVNSNYVKTTKFTQKMFDQHANDLIGYELKYAAFEGKTPRQLIRAGLIKEEDLPDKYLQNMDKKIDSLADFHNEIQKSAYDTSGNLLNESLRTKHAYLDAIFERLNIGVNVFVVPWNYKDDIVPNINTQALSIPYPTSTDAIVIDVGVDPNATPSQKSNPIDAGVKKIVNAVKNNGIAGSIQNAVSNEWNRTKADFNMFKDQALDAFGGKVDEAYLLNDVERLTASDKEQDNRDAVAIKTVMSSLKTSTEDGDINEDIGNLKDAISQIEDPEAKRRISGILQKTIEMSKQQKKPKSILGKAVLFVFGAFKVVVNKVKSTVGKMLGKYLKWVTKMFKSSAKNIVTGAKAFKEGLIGNKDGTQKGLIRDTIAWGKQKASNVWNSRLVTGVRNVGEHAAESLKTLGGKAIDKAKDMGSSIADKSKPILSALGEAVKGAVSKVGSTAMSIKDSASDKFDKLKDKFAQTSFGSGFMSAFDDKDGKPEITSTSLFDKRAADINDIVQDSATGTFFATLVSSVKEYSESLTDYFDLLSDEAEKEEEAKKRIQEQKKKRAEEEKKKKEEAERKKKEEAERKKKEAEEAAKKKASAKSGIGFDLGKMVGGFTKILQGIMKSVGTIIKSMTGLMAIMEIGDQILKKSLKPLNKVFFQIYNLLKPIVKLVTKILKSVVEAVVTIVKSVVNVIQPIFDVIEPIISSLLETLMPILDMITQVVNILLVPMTAMLKVTVIPILRGIGNMLQMLTGILQVGFGIVMTALGGWLMATGMILKWLTHSDSLAETGKQLFNTGTSMVQSGAKSYVSGIKGQIALLKDQAVNIVTLGTKNAGLDDDEKESKPINRKTTKLHGSALEGTYGSGDYDTDDLYELDGPVKDALKTLKGTGKKFLNFFMPEDEDDDITNGGLKELQKLTQRLIGVFTGEEDDTVSERLAKESGKLTEDQVIYSASDLTDEEKTLIEQIAYENFRKDHPQRETETNEDYRKRYESSYKQKYVNAATAKYLHEKNEKALAGEDDGAMSIINSTTGDDGMISKFSSGMESVDNSVQAGQFGDVISDYVSSLTENGSSSKKRRSGSNQDAIEFTGQLAKGNIWDHHKNKAGVRDFMETAFGVGLTGAQVATIASMGIWEDGGDKLWGPKSLTATTYDIHGQRAQGIMNWVDPNVDYGDTLAEQLQYVQRVYFSGSSNDSRAKVQKNSYWDADEAGFKTATGRSGFKFTPGKNYGPPMESDLVEGSEHFYRTALVPECIHTAEGPRKYIGTAAGVYNWLLDEGYIDAGDYEEDDDTGGSTNDWIRTVAMMFEGYYYNGDKYYDNVNVHKFKIRDGRTVSARPDCSGMLGAAMTAFGYKLDYPPSSSHYNVTGHNRTTDFIKNADGTPTSDWKWLPFSKDKLRSGDITGNEGHASFPIVNLTDDYPKGFDAGGSTNIAESAKAARALLDGDSSIPYRTAMGAGHFTNGHGDHAQYIMRYVGGRGSNDQDSGSKSSSRKKSSVLSGNTMEEKVYKYLTSKGMSGIGAAGMMGCFKYESNFQPNNLENSYQAKWGYPAGEAGDKQYTADVDSKRESERQFVTSRGTGTSGYGIPQFTASNLKQDLYNRTVKKGITIADTRSQLDSILNHLKKNAKVNGTTLFDKIKQSPTPTEANKWFLWRYEAGVAYNSDASVAAAYPWMGMKGINDRHSAAEQYYDMYGGGMDDTDVGYVDTGDYDMSYIESVPDTLMSQAEQQDYIFADLEEADIELPTGDGYAIPTIQTNIPIPTLPESFGGFTTQSRPIVINQFDSEFDLSQYVNAVLTNEYNVESSRIKELVDGIFEELPEYLEDDDDDFTEEDDLFIQQLASAFI